MRTDRKGAMPFVAVALVAVAAIGLTATGNMPSLSGADIPSAPSSGDTVEQGKDATLSLAAFDQTEDGSSQANPTIYAWKDNGERVYLGSQSGSTSSRTTYSEFVTGDDFEAFAFGSTYDYGVKVSGAVDAEKELKNLDTYEGISSGSLSTNIYDKNGDSTSSVSLGNNEEYGFSHVDVSTDADKKSYNPHLIAFEHSGNTDSNVSSIDMPGAREVTCPDSMDSTMSAAPDKCFVAFNSNEGEPTMGSWDTQETGTVVVKADGDGTGGDTLEYAINDLAPYLDQDNEIAWGVEDDASSPTDNGVSAITGSVTLN